MNLQPLFPTWAILSGFLLVASFLGLLEWRRSLKWRWIRLGALVLALLAIAGLLLRPSRKIVQATNPLILLTPQYDRQIVDSLRAAHPQWEIWRTAEAAAYPRSKVLGDQLDLTEMGPRIGAIVGEGLPPPALEYFQAGPLQFFPAAPPTGITALMPRSYHEGKLNQIEGQYFHRGAPVHLRLDGPGAPEDSMMITSPGYHRFSLGFVPRESGRWMYRLQVRDSLGRQLEEQILGLNVLPAEQLRILILQAFPTFELRYLKDFLADRGHAVAVRTQISRDKYRTEFANLPSRPLGRLSAELLADFDLLLLNGSTYEQLDDNERSIIGTAVDAGLGFLGVIDGDYRTFRRQMGWYRIAAEPDTTSVDPGTTVLAYNGTPDPDLEWYSIQKTATGRPLSGYHYQGRGKVGFQAIQESYPSLLRGDSLTYAEIWMPLLEGVQRTELPQLSIELLNDFPVFAGHPLDFRIVAAAPLPEVYADTVLIPMMEDYTVDNIWYGRTWPQGPGWHYIRVGEEQLDYYAYPEGAWPAMAGMQARKHTTLVASPVANPESRVLQSTVHQPIAAWWFYLLFLLAAGFLWLAPKL